MHVHEGASSTYNAGLERWLNLLRHQPIPIDISSEERMPLDLISSVIAQPPLRIPVQQSGHHTPRFRGDVRGEVERIGQDALVHDVHILIVERRQSGHHLIDQYTESPPVDSLCIPLAFEELRCDVLRCTAEGYGRTDRLASNDESLAGEKDLTCGLLGLGHVQFAQAEITERDVTGVIQQDILGLQVTIDDIKPVKVFQGAK